MNRPYIPRTPFRHAATLYPATLLLRLLHHITTLPNKPPLTLTLILLQSLLHLLPRRYHPPLHHICLNPRAVLSGQPHRLLTPTFIHLSHLHLLHNMTSLLSKGVILEPVLTAPLFLSVIVYLAVAAHAIFVTIAYAAYSAGSDGMMSRCVVGFSGVLFGLKVIMACDTRFARRDASLLGVRMPRGLQGVAVELVVAQILVPRASFLAHLSGVLAGLIYVFASAMISRRVNARPR